MPRDAAAFLPGVTWEQFNKSTHSYYRITGIGCTMETYLHGRYMPFWMDVVAYVLNRVTLTPPTCTSPQGPDVPIIVG